MTIEGTIVLLILAGTLILFATEWLRPDLVALLVLGSLTLTGLVAPEEALAGFSNSAVVTVWAMFIISGGLAQTGVARLIGQQMLRLAGEEEPRLLLVLMLTVGILSAFMNNVGVAALLLPVVMDLARQTKRPPSKLLLPLAFGALLGGLTTLIGTPPNLLVSEGLEEIGLRPFQFFDFARMGVVVLLAGIAYMLLVGRHLLPIRDVREETKLLNGLELEELYRLDDNLFTLRVPPDSPLAGQTLHQSQLGAKVGVTVVGVVRDGISDLAPPPSKRLQAGDQLLLTATSTQLAELKAEGLLIVERQLGEPSLELNGNDGKRAAPTGLAELILSPHTTYVDKTLRQLHFREKYGANVVAIWRRGQPYYEDLGDMALRRGDALLVQGTHEQVKLLGAEPDFVVLQAELDQPLRVDKAPLAVGTTAVMLLLVLTNWLPIAIAAIIAASLMVLTGCLQMEEAYRAIDWRAVFLIAGMLPLGAAMDSSGLALFMAEGVQALLGGWGAVAVLGGLFLLTTATTQVMPNAAVTVLMIPIALTMAERMGVSPYPLLMGVSIAASASFLSPVSHPANILIMGPGGYRFADYIKVGLPLTLIILLLVVLLLPLIWPF